ncbi:hypothetical protein BJ138DRAFT_1220392 [Hygrophoropsis aurantiaca]|uniref:Uncharacterized protein n=1 Tax=Hygrophoropsis aurantiaca TaxID=72124 RepID=A0ACB8A0F0_9AGAM|nr:hypothetical protein BJ138DRAFT_1220392 [Hygrophoropsis aurantiaca]
MASKEDETTSYDFPCFVCHVLHAMLVVVHLSLVGVAVHHMEHNLILPITSTTDEYPIISSASMQAFYTLYTTSLVYVTQHVSLLRYSRRRQSLTSIHDLSGARAGFGLALNCLWEQLHRATSPLTIVAVAIYFLAITIVHVASSSIIQFQTFNGTVRVSAPTTLGWPTISAARSSPFDYPHDVLPDDLRHFSMYGVDWNTVWSVAPYIDRIPSMTRAGLADGIIYDVFSSQSGTGNASVGGTRIDTDCSFATGLVQDDLIWPGWTKSNYGLQKHLGAVPWKDQVLFHPRSLKGRELTFVITTAIDESPEVLQKAVIPMNWTMSGVGDLPPPSQARTTMLLTPPKFSTAPQKVFDPDTWSPSRYALSDSPGLLISNWVWFGMFFATQVGPQICSSAANGCYSLSTSEIFLMQLLNITPSTRMPNNPAYSSNTTPSVILTLQEIEDGVSNLLARCVWTGLLGKEGGGFERSTGSTLITEFVLQLHLNINWIPLSFALSASIALFIAELYLTRAVTNGTNRKGAVKGLGMLELIWLASHSSELRDGIGPVENPNIDHLRTAGMFNVCFADIRGKEGSGGENLGGLPVPPQQELDSYELRSFGSTDCTLITIDSDATTNDHTIIDHNSPFPDPGDDESTFEIPYTFSSKHSSL